jgi:hypothetical protein
VGRAAHGDAGAGLQLQASAKEAQEVLQESGYESPQL